MEIQEHKARVSRRIDELQEDLWQISDTLYKNPEIAFEEHQAAALLTEKLTRAGFTVERPLGELDTAFRATLDGQGGGPTIAILAEYDALPGLGHACGHNLIAAGAVGAGLGVMDVLDELPGQIQVIGTPAEEGGGGKQILAEAGVFQDIDAAIMFHPASKNMVSRGSLASTRLVVEFFGKASHAAAAPEDGINALDACLLMFNNIHALRQHLTSKDRVAGIITHGGEAVNIIPAYSQAKFSIRSKNNLRRDQVLEKVIACIEAAACATRCEFKYDIIPGYADIIPSKVIGKLFGENLAMLGRDVVPPDPDERMGSTDMGDISHLVPSIHAYIATVPSDVPGHSEEYREICMTSAGKSAMLDAAKALAMTTVDLLSEPNLVSRARAELDECLSRRNVIEQ